jgi:hypothetical protein
MTVMTIESYKHSEGEQHTTIHCLCSANCCHPSLRGVWGEAQEKAYARPIDSLTKNGQANRGIVPGPRSALKTGVIITARVGQRSLLDSR